MGFSTRTGTSRLWKPTALRAPVLVVTILLCWALIAVLQYFLTRSQREQGVIFAPKISELPLSHTFLYLYFPTILAVTFSIYWTWIDLETKRMEPYYQLSKENGALGKDSLLLAYPFDFIPLVPIKALKDRHWPVFWASFAVVLVTWGLVPTQAGIFSIGQVTRTTNVAYNLATSSVPVEEQARTLTLRYAQSTYGIAALNETLPPFMARNYTLEPFARIETSKSTADNDISVDQGTLTAPTTMYFADLYCEDVSHKSNNAKEIDFVSNSGCNFTLGLDGNLTIGENPNPGMIGGTLAIKKFTGMYVGYKDPNGFSDYSLDVVCPENQTSIFYAAFQKNKERETDAPNDVTAVYCQPRYYQQAVTATVDILTQRPITVVPLEDKQAIRSGLFNSSTFEILLTAASLGTEVRSDNLPAKATPKYLETIAAMDVGLTSGSNGGATVQPMVGLALAVGNHSLEDYLDWKILSKSYADAYRLIFARAMVEVLNPSNISDGEAEAPRQVNGQQQVVTEAVILEPVFVYIVEGFLGVVSLCTIALLYLSITRSKNLRSNPGTIASVMSLVADSQPLLSDFEKLDCCTIDEMKDFVGQKRYKLVDDGSGTSILEVAPSLDDLDSPQSPMLGQSRQDTPSNIAKPVRPVEFSIWTAIPLVSLFTTLVICLTIVFVKARVQGLPMPSSNTFVQNVLENYIPTAIATMIEPIWVLLNRLLCMLQPLEELQNCNARAEKSIDLDYSSLPPQLVIGKALRSKHFVLAAVCSMALLSNLLAVAFAGLFQQDTFDMRQPASLTAPLDLKFVSINGSVGPDPTQTYGSDITSGAYRGGNGEDQFLVSESNYTRGTLLPAWTDDRMFYMPFLSEQQSSTNASTFEAVTRAFGAELDCKELEFGTSFQSGLVPYMSGKTAVTVMASVNITITKGSTQVQCVGPDHVELRKGPIGGSCAIGPSAAELVTLLQPRRANASQAEIEACREYVVLGWIRNPNHNCDAFIAQPFSKENSTFLQCTQKWMTGSGKIRVDASGRLQQQAQELNLKTSTSTDNNGTGFESVFSNDPINLIGQSNLYLFQGNSPAWHNDSYANDYINYFMRKAVNSSRLVDPHKALPTFHEIIDPLNKAYSSLFAIWLGLNKDNLFVPSDQPQNNRVEGWRLETQTRLFVSTPMFVISETILCTYIIVAIMVYLRRPGQYLPRMPTSIASVIALFAASAAVQDMRGTSHLDKKGRARHLEALDARYGYGSFVGGGDGRVHIGIERTPFIRVRSKSTWFEKRMPLFRKGSAGS